MRRVAVAGWDEGAVRPVANKTACGSDGSFAVVEMEHGVQCLARQTLVPCNRG